MPTYTILGTIYQSPATGSNGHFTRVDLPAGTVCEGDGVVEGSGFGQFVVVSCTVGGKKYNTIALFKAYEGENWEERVEDPTNVDEDPSSPGGKRKTRKRRSKKRVLTKKAKKSRNRSHSTTVR